MKTQRTNLVARIAMALLAGMMVLALASCNEKNSGSGAVGADGLTKAQAKLLKEKPAPEADFEIKLSDDGSYVTITRYKGKAVKTLVIPATIQGLPVKEVNGVGYGETLTSVVIPEGVVSVGVLCFKNCPGLMTVVLPSTLKGIKSEAFSGCKKLTTVNLPEGLVCIGEAAFCRTALASVTLPKSLKAMGQHAFLGCDELAEINIPDGLSLIMVYTSEELSVFPSFALRNKIRGSAYNPKEAGFSEFFSGEKINESVALQQLLRDHKTVAIDYKTWENKYCSRDYKDSSAWDW